MRIGSGIVPLDSPGGSTLQWACYISDSRLFLVDSESPLGRLQSSIVIVLHYTEHQVQT